MRRERELLYLAPRVCTPERRMASAETNFPIATTTTKASEFLNYTGITLLVVKVKGFKKQQHLFLLRLGYNHDKSTDMELKTNTKEIQ